MHEARTRHSSLQPNFCVRVHVKHKRKSALVVELARSERGIVKVEPLQMQDKQRRETGHARPNARVTLLVTLFTKHSVVTRHQLALHVLLQALRQAALALNVQTQ